jgi:hypothetical protein
MPHLLHQNFTIGLRPMPSHPEPAHLTGMDRRSNAPANNSGWLFGNAYADSSQGLRKHTNNYRSDSISSTSQLPREQAFNIAQT